MLQKIKLKYKEKKEEGGVSVSVPEEGWERAVSERAWGPVAVRR